MDAELATRNTSKLAFYRGLIALAWADHSLHADEKAKLHEIIEGHRDLAPDDKVMLHGEVDTPVSLDAVWLQITDVQDRARLIDMSNVIFQQDNDICDDERGMINRFSRKHLSSIGIEQITQDLADFSETQQREREIRREELKAYAKQYSLFACVSAAFGRK